MGARELILVRHGESEANVAAAEAERTGAERIALPARDADVELSPTGRDQARAIGLHLAEFALHDQPGIVWVSPYRRARQTAAIALEAAGITLPTHVDERIRDRELGILDSYTSLGVDTRFPDEAERRRFLGKFYYRPPGGESWADVALRVRSVLTDIDLAAEREDDDRRVLIVCHDAVVSLFRYVCEDLEERVLLDTVRANPMPNASFTRLVRTGNGSWKAVSVNDVSHLEHHDADITKHSGDPDGTKP